ncbi:hypothetical protein FHL15_002296 [Xylaria flabelliformis]|uniref:Uncharacterized protein n=1 Tax=Xylaria flabelliformis TaxID=2512241 RepID=A0A553I9W4_9PEZI|nr:hypothetical protein FHL15_002296 [Xylaria flabelliformis]
MGNPACGPPEAMPTRGYSGVKETKEVKSDQQPNGTLPLMAPARCNLGVSLSIVYRGDAMIAATQEPSLRC